MYSSIKMYLFSNDDFGDESPWQLERWRPLPELSQVNTSNKPNHARIDIWTLSLTTW